MSKRNGDGTNKAGQQYDGFETFHVDIQEAETLLRDGGNWADTFQTEDPSDLVGWYWWPCQPGCIPDTDEPFGPHEDEDDAIQDACLDRDTND